MSGNHQQHQKEERQNGRRPAPRSRAITLTAAGVLASVIVFQTAFAGSKNPGIQQVYPGPTPGGSGTGGGLSTAETAGIAVGAAAVVGGGLFAAGVFRRKRHHNEKALHVALGDAQDGPLIRLLPAQEELDPGASCAFDLQVRDQDGKWQSVTEDDDVSIEVQGESDGVVLQKGTRNVFCLPITAGASEGGKSVTFVGTYAPEGAAPLTAQAQVRVGATP